MELTLFILVALAAVTSALLVVIGKNPVYSVLFLVSAFFCLAILYVMLGAPFVAALQVIVYAGAIMVLFLFVVMLLNLRDAQSWDVTGSMRRWIGFATAGAVLLVALAAVRGVFDPGASLRPEMGNAESIGSALFTRFLLPFEVASILLLTAIIGVVTLLKRDNAKSQAKGGEA